MPEKDTDVLLEIEFQRIIMCSCPGRQRWCREAYGVHGIEGCLDPEFKNCGGQRGLSWWRKQNEQCLGDMETFQCAWRRAKSEICHCSRLRSHGIQTETTEKTQVATALSGSPKRLHFIVQAVESYIGLLSNWLVDLRSPLLIIENKNNFVL